MTFSILTWNIWYRNQIEGKVKLSRLLDELKQLVDQHQPDFVAFCEVVKSSQLQTPLVIEYLQRLGYDYSHYAKMYELPGCWTSSVSLSSRLKLSEKQIHVISKQAYAANRGYAGLDREIISALVTLPEGPDARIIAAHPHAIADSFSEHKVGMKNLQKLVRSDTYARNSVLVGDMNEGRFMTGAFRRKVADVMYSQTGSILNPTWRYNAHRFTPLRLNLDYVYWSKQSDFQLKDFQVLRSHVSDHQPLLAIFEYNSKSNE